MGAGVAPACRGAANKTCHTSSRKRGVALAEKTRPDLIPPFPPPTQTAWFALVASAEFMLHDVQNEAFPEQLRERLRLFGEKSRPRDFFLVSQPTWLDAKAGAAAPRVRRPAVALVSTDEVWIKFMKLRLDRVLEVELGEMTPAEALASSGPPPDFAPLDRSPKAGEWTAPYSPYKPGWWAAFTDTAGVV